MPADASADSGGGLARLHDTLSSEPEATEALAEGLGRLLEPGDVLALDGELGAGKTTFVRGLARGLGVTEDVSSPTFILMNTYAGRVPLYHLDAWMAERGDAFLAEGGAEWLGGGGVAVVEWADLVRAWLPDDTLWVRLSHRIRDGVEARRIRLEGPREAWQRRLAGLPAPGETPGTAATDE